MNVRRDFKRLAAILSVVGGLCGVAIVVGRERGGVDPPTLFSHYYVVAFIVGWGLVWVVYGVSCFFAGVFMRLSPAFAAKGGPREELPNFPGQEACDSSMKSPVLIAGYRRNILGNVINLDKTFRYLTWALSILGGILFLMSMAGEIRAEPILKIPLLWLLIDFPMAFLFGFVPVWAVYFFIRRGIIDYIAEEFTA